MSNGKSKNFCEDCGDKKRYSDEFDAFYCEKCNKWLESICDDTNCEFCIRRPQTPENLNK
jgi:hypothetical protein